MPVVSVAGSQFTVTIGATAYSAQITGGTITTTSTITRTKTLSDVAYPQTDLMYEAALDYLYDEETGLYGAINTAMQTGTGLTVAIVGGDAKWTGTMYATGNEVKFAADGIAEASVSLTGSLTLADNP